MRPRGRPPRTRTELRGLLLSVLCHTGLVVVALLPGTRPARQPTHPIAFAVERSLLAHDAAPASPPELVLPTVEAESGPETAVAAAVELPIEPFAVPDHPSPAPGAAPPNRLAEWAEFARTPLHQKPPEARPATFLPTQRPEAAEAAAAADTARPDVPAAIPGENPAPEYPAFARRRGIEGTVLVGIEVDAGGGAAACRIVTSSGSTSLDHAALAAARRWRFMHGPGHVEVPFVFQIRS